MDTGEDTAEYYSTTQNDVADEFGQPSDFDTYLKEDEMTNPQVVDWGANVCEDEVMQEAHMASKEEGTVNGEQSPSGKVLQ